jgi:hypothetical protein
LHALYQAKTIGVENPVDRPFGAGSGSRNLDP